MPDIYEPVLTLRIKLPHRFHVRCVIWENMAALKANTPEAPKKDYVALFVPVDAAGSKCVGTIHLSKTDISNGMRAHEISHAISEFMDMAFDETRSEATAHVTEEIDAALRSIGLIY